jgi:hypothetical protein
VVQTQNQGSMFIRFNDTVLITVIDICHSHDCDNFPKVAYIKIITAWMLFFLPGRMGNNKEALHLIIEKEANVEKVYSIHVGLFRCCKSIHLGLCNEDTFGHENLPNYQAHFI